MGAAEHGAPGAVAVRQIIAAEDSIGVIEHFTSDRRMAAEKIVQLFVLVQIPSAGDQARVGSEIGGNSGVVLQERMEPPYLVANGFSAAPAIPGLGSATRDVQKRQSGDDSREGRFVSKNIDWRGGASFAA